MPPLETPDPETVVPEPVVTDPPVVTEPPVEDPPLAPAGEKALEAFKKRARESEAREKELAEKVKSFEDRDKSDQERLADEAATAKAEAARVTAENMRLRVAGSKKLPAELVDRLQGETLDELEADADKLLALVKPADATDFDGGNRGTQVPAAGLEEQIRAAEASGDWELASALKVRKLEAQS